MIALDGYILEFVSNNFVAIIIFLAILKELAIYSKNNTDDKIISFVIELLGKVKK